MLAISPRSYCRANRGKYDENGWTLCRRDAARRLARQFVSLRAPAAAPCGLPLPGAMSPSATARNRGAAPLVASNRCAAIMLPIGAMMSSGADNLVELPTVPFRIRARWRSKWIGWLARQGTQTAENPCQLTDSVQEILAVSSDTVTVLCRSRDSRPTAPHPLTVVPEADLAHGAP